MSGCLQALRLFLYALFIIHIMTKDSVPAGTAKGLISRPLETFSLLNEVWKIRQFEPFFNCLRIMRDTIS